MYSIRVVIAGILSIAAAGANAQSFERQLVQISQKAGTLALPSRQAFIAPNAQMAAVQGPAAWQKVTAPDGTFTIEMPGTPKYSTYEGGDVAFTHHQFNFDDGEREFGASTMIYRPTFDMSNPNAYLQRLLDANEKTMDGAKWISVGMTKHQGLPAAVAVGLYHGRTARFLFVVRGQQYFGASYYGPDGTARSEDVNRFIDSLNIR